MSNSPGGIPPKPPSLEKRLPIALALMMLVLLVSQYVFKPAPGAKPVKPVNDKESPSLVQPPAAATPATAQTQAQTQNQSRNQAANVPGAAGQVQAVSEVTTDVDTDLYHIVFTNRGAVVKSWVLKRFYDTSGKPLELIATKSGETPLPF